MHVRTNIIAGEQSVASAFDWADPFAAVVDLYKTANVIVENSLTDPSSLKLLMQYLPSANQ